jgi:hypothetical protein
MVIATNYFDDYLFQLDDGRYAHVHLTFSRKQERPPWPGTALFGSLADWRLAVDETQRDEDDSDDIH